MTINDLRKLKDDELKTKLSDLNTEYLDKKFAILNNSLSDTSVLRKIKKDTAEKICSGVAIFFFGNNSEYFFKKFLLCLLKTPEGEITLKFVFSKAYFVANHLVIPKIPALLAE